jgi:integrase
VCDRGDGGPLDPSNFTHAFKAIAKRAGLPPEMRLHDVRHGVATALLQEGVHSGITSALLGRASPAFTMKTYQHMLDQMTAQAAAALDRPIAPRPSAVRRP